MDMDNDHILEAARSIRPHLQELIPDQADAVDALLAQSLNREQPGPAAANAIIAALRSHESTRKWLAEFLKDPRFALTRSFDFKPPLGEPVPVGATKYVCPQGDYTWYRISAGTPIRSCPTHGVTLVATP